MASNIVFTAEKTEISEQESFSIRRTGWDSWDASLPWATLSDCTMTLTAAFSLPAGSTARGTTYQVQNVAGSYRPKSRLQWLDDKGEAYILSIYTDELPLLAAVLADLATEQGQPLDLDFTELTPIKPGSRFDNQLADAVKDEDTELSKAISASVVDGTAGLSADVADLKTLTNSGRLSGSSLDQRYALRTVNDVTLFGASPTVGVNNTAAIQAAIANSISTGLPLYIPRGVFEAINLVVSGATGLYIKMDGVLKRPNNSARSPILTLKDSTNIKFDVMYTDGNVANNFYEGYPVDEAKHDIRIDNVTGLTGSFIHSQNPAGDSVYIAGGVSNNTSKVHVGRVYSRSDTDTGRNALSIIKGSDMVFDSVESINTGYPGNVSPARIAMPGGVDIEPNSAADTVDNITIGSILARSAGSTGFCLFSVFGKVITNVTIGNVLNVRTSAALAGTNAWVIRGVKNVKIGGLIHNGNGYASSGASIDDAENVTLNADIYNVLNSGLTIGVSASVDNLRFQGTIDGCTGHGMQIYTLNNSDFLCTVKNHGTAHAALSKINSGSSSNVRFRGSFAKGTKGALMTSISGAVTNWVLDGVDCSGWGNDTKLKGTNAGDLTTRGCANLNFADALPNFDTWRIGTRIDRITPAPGTSPGWIATATGTGGAANWEAMPALSGTLAQTLAAPGAVTLDASKGDQVVTLNANATSSSITNASSARPEMSVTFVQDVTGGRTYTWPTNCRFVGGAAPSDTTLSTRTTVRFRYDSTTTRWNELYRAVAVPNV